MKICFSSKSRIFCSDSVVDAVEVKVLIALVDLHWSQGSQSNKVVLVQRADKVELIGFTEAGILRVGIAILSFADRAN